MATGPSLVSVIVPSYNGARYLAEALESALGQTHPAVEVVVVDDGSTDDTPPLLARYGDRVRAIRQKNRGLSAARNTGIRAARGVYLALLDHDDRYLPEKVARQAAVLDARPDVGLVYSGWHFIDAEGRRFPPTGWARHEGEVLSALVLGNFIFPAATMVRRALVDEVGGFDESLRGLEDWDLWLRLTCRGMRWACIDAPLLEYRLHAGQMHRGGAARREAARTTILDRVFADPALPPAARALASRAYHNINLRAALDYYRAGERAPAAEAFYRAVHADPGFVVDPKQLQEFCRFLAPPGRRRLADIAARWRPLTRTLRTAIGDLLARPGLDPAIARLRWRARIAVLRVTGRLARKRLQALARWPPPPLSVRPR